jgi:hypothetical protein
MPAFMEAGDHRRGEPPQAAGETGWSPAERALLHAALEFYGAASAVIEYRGPERPHLRADAAGLRAVRDAMGALDRHVLVAHEAGVAPAQIARITRLEPEIVALILQRARGLEPDPAHAE